MTPSGAPRRVAIGRDAAKDPLRRRQCPGFPVGCQGVLRQHGGHSCDLYWWIPDGGRALREY